MEVFLVLLRIRGVFFMGVYIVGTQLELHDYKLIFFLFIINKSPIFGIFKLNYIREKCLKYIWILTEIIVIITNFEHDLLPLCTI